MLQSVVNMAHVALASSVLAMLCGSNEASRVINTGTLYLSRQGGSLSCASNAA